MRPLAARRLFPIATVVFLLGACHGRVEQPPDFRHKGFDAREAAQLADTIVLATVVDERDIRSLAIPEQNRPQPLNIEETETTLQTLRVLKGSALPGRIRFRYYDGRANMINGPPQGPSGGVRSMGIFFLFKGPSQGIFRSVVDIFRPDIATPWILGSPEPAPCGKAPPDCIAELLLRYRKSDDELSFSKHLKNNAAISKLLIGFLETYDILNVLAANEANPDSIRRAACLELSDWYALELPSVCRSLLACGSAALRYPVAASRLREDLKKGGLPWVESRIGTADRDQIKRYLELLMKVPDEQTRRASKDLARKVK